MDQVIMTDVITATEALAAELAAACAGGTPAVPQLIRLGFEELLNRIEALPPDTPNMGFYRNWARSSRTLWEDGEGFLASYQLTQIGRKLERLKMQLG